MYLILKAWYGLHDMYRKIIGLLIYVGMYLACQHVAVVPVPSLLSTRDLLTKQGQLMQCCVQCFTLLEAIVDEQMLNEYHF